MRHIFKASFEQQGDAQQLMDELAAAGYTHAELGLSGATRAGPYTRQRHAVTLSVDSELEAKGASVIIERANPARIQELQDGDPFDDASTDVEAGIASGGTPPVYPPGTEPGALQFHRLDNGHLFGTQDAEAPPAGMTFQERMGTASSWPGADENPVAPNGAAPRQEGQEGGNAVTRAAYQFGKAMRMDERYRNRSWDEAEPGLEKEWAAGAEQGSTWDSVRSIVRSGWNLSTPEIDDDSYYRSHWTTSYGDRGGDDAMPAYMDSSEARRSERYRSHDAGTADEVPLERASGHEEAHHSVWYRVKEAVRHGWGRGRH